jgi:hypothetical protein
MIWTNEQYDGKKLYIGKYNVAGVCRTCSREPNKRYRAWCTLPGIKEFLGYYPDVKTAAERIDGAVGLWLHNAKLKEPDDGICPSVGADTLGEGKEGGK